MANKDIFRQILETKIIQIYGPAGLGKSTLAMSLMQKLLIEDPGIIFLMDTETKFSIKRFKRIMIPDSENKLSDKIMEYIMVTSPKTLEEQYSSIKSICKYSDFSKHNSNVRAIVMDSASFQYRTMSESKNWVEYSNNTHNFYENHILPLLIIQKQTDCYLILVHQVSHHPNKGILPYLSNLFKKIPSLWIELRVNKFRNLNEMRFNFEQLEVEYNYILSNAGFIFA